ncbi:hypothetical protein CVT24_003348 [Panaeolus cyanescens]|uniref:RING-type domain-containing protein n=1 Tax=Panaeolus cyanescens TaxID=181874 RepID=A0A409Y722_9AGAR|nr:hypothetical protein CVT24_003348 [Panaeolus cyanescens]
MYNYLETPNNNLICCICRAPFLDPLTSKLCSHTFCSACIHQALSHSSQCPIDRTHLTEKDLERAPNIVRAMVDELQVECVYAPPRKEQYDDDGELNKGKQTIKDVSDDIPGCKWTGERATLGAHLEVCEFAEGNKDKLKSKDPTHLKAKTASKEDRSHNASNSPSGSGSSSGPLDPTGPGTPVNLFQTLPQTISGTCPHSMYGCPYVVPADVTSSQPTELNGEDSSAIIQADIETHLTTCPYESIKGFFNIFNSTISSQKEVINDSKRREDSLRATIQDLKENEKRAKLVLEQNILLKKRLESLEGAVASLKKELTSIKTALGPWATGPSSTRSTPNFATTSSMDGGVNLNGMNRYISAAMPVGPSPQMTTFAATPSVSDHSPERTSPASQPAGAGWGNLSQEIPPVNAGSSFVTFSPRLDESTSGNPGLANDAFASYFPNQGEEFPTAASSHPQHRRTTSLVSLPLMIPPLDTSGSLERTLQRLHASVSSIGATVEGMTVQMEGVARRGEIGLANEAVRVGEEIGSLRAQIYGLRMLVHGLMVERGVGTRWPGAANPGGGPGMNMSDSDDEQRNPPGPYTQTVPMGMPPPPPFFLRNAGIGMGMGPMGGPSITKL